MFNKKNNLIFIKLFTNLIKTDKIIKILKNFFF